MLSSNPGMTEIFKSMGIEVDYETFDLARKNLRFKKDYAELQALINEFGMEAVIDEINKVQKTIRK